MTMFAIYLKKIDVLTGYDLDTTNRDITLRFLIELGS